MLLTLRSAWNWLDEKPHHEIGVRLLRILLGSAVLLRVATESRFARFFWGPHGIGRPVTAQYFGRSGGHLANWAFSSMPAIFAMLGLLAIGAVLLVVGKRERLATALVLLMSVCFESRLPDLLDGGDNLARLVLFFMVFLLPAGAKPAPRSIAVWLHNLAVVAIGAQLSIVYFTAGIMKLAGGTWRDGTALYVVSRIDWFSNETSRALFKIPVVTTLGCYVTVLLQVWFPVATLSRLRVPWVVSCTLLHLGIAYAMGLVSFSLIMIASEACVLSDNDYLSIISAWHRLQLLVTPWGKRMAASVRQ
jgi:hypothetical protein